ncbi:alpha-N-acetylgalactosamine-specific lectin-like [Branchiostoma floridae]|uniref:Alpha-N-acetylgalactosamine-specific lectin-like n=1 Tax=Branchiostoma floridae TaxID=7739 RepID=A0A9J7MUM5_BRAFL|nr:alpha-N-acetylgalactosamine-specific lectin-like [Branchiostoma floridae]
MFRGTCYKAFNTRKTFSDSAAACGEDGGTLAMPRDAETDAFLISLHSGKRPFWFGLHDQREEGSFEWVDGSALGTYNSWCPGEPNNYRGREDCVLHNSEDEWNDAKCNRKYRFICQTVPGRPLATGGTLTTNVLRLSDHPQ